MSRLFVLGLLTEMLIPFTAPMRPFIETNPLRRGGPLCPPTCKCSSAFDDLSGYEPVATASARANKPL